MLSTPHSTQVSPPLRMVQPQTSCSRGKDHEAAGSWARSPVTHVTSRAPEEAVVASERRRWKRPQRQPVASHLKAPVSVTK